MNKKKDDNMPKNNPDVLPEHKHLLDVATRRTTPVIIYKMTSGGSKPIKRGTGFFLNHGSRSYVVTNAHVLKHYCEGRKIGSDVGVQIWSGNGEIGSEFHAGYLVTQKNKCSIVLGVSNLYDHRDIGLVELTSEAAKLASKEKEFIELEDLRSDLLPGSIVFYKGYPKKSVEFHGSIKVGKVGQWLDVRKVDKVSPQLIIAQPTIAVYRSAYFPEEDGKDLKGISGSALIAADDLRVVGVVWGSLNHTVDSAIYAVPAATVRELVLEYENHDTNAGAI